MGDTIYLHFDGLKAPVQLIRAQSLLPLLAKALPNWPVQIRQAPTDTPEFIRIVGVENTMFAVVVTAEKLAPRRWNAVNAICDLISEMAWEKLRSHPELLCVHGAAVEFCERLVLFPNTRRAGKSTLAAVLARLGQTVFTDDFLPIEIAQNRVISGLATGVAPRIRLPIPPEFSQAFNAWVAADSGPANPQYKFLSDAPLAKAGAARPLGAIVTLLRRDDPTPPRLEPISRAAAMEAMIVQNFARAIESGAILKTVEALTASLPAYQLTYHSGEEAAAYLQAHAAFSGLPVAKLAPEIVMRQAPLGHGQAKAHAFDHAQPHRQCAGVTEIKTDDAHFLTDKNGMAIHRLNPGSSAIWRLLAEPIGLDEIVAVLCAAFPDIAPAQIRADSLAALQQFAHSRLIETAPAVALQTAVAR